MSNSDPRVHQTGDEHWLEVLATVTACTYGARAGRAMAFGAPSSKHFLIAYNYWAAGEFHTGEFYSEAAIAQGELFPIAVNPEALHEHGQTQAAALTSTQTRVSMLTVGVAGSIVLSLAYALFLYGCSHR